MTSSSMDFLGVPRLHYLSKCSSPCVILQNNGGDFSLVNKTDLSSEKAFWQDAGSNVLGCLPSVYLLGVGKCGTTYLHSWLSQHRSLRTSQRKEMEFWNNGGRWESPFYKDDYNHSRYNLFAYMRLSSIVAQEIYKNIHSDLSRIHDLHQVTKNRLLIIDSSTTNMFSSRAVKLTSLVPNAKAVLILRDPVYREFSAFRFAAQIKGKSKITWFQDQTPEGFDKYMNYVLTKPADKRFTLSTYSEFVKQLLHIFPKRNLAILQYEEFVLDPVGIIESEVLPVLNLRPFLKEEKDNFLPSLKTNKGRYVYEMLDKTKVTLQHYFSKYNAELSRLLGDRKWTWGY